MKSISGKGMMIAAALLMGTATASANPSEEPESPSSAIASLYNFRQIFMAPLPVRALMQQPRANT